MDVQSTLQELSMLPGPSGHESPVADRMVAFYTNVNATAYVDKFGNAIGERPCGKTGAKRVLLDAHMDEIGLIVTEVKEGFLRFASIGGIDPRILPNQAVTVLSDPPIPGLILSMPPHLQTAETQKHAYAIEDLWIDIGLPQEDAARTAPIGTAVVFQSDFTALQQEHWAGKALDNRAGLVAMLLAAHLLKDEVLDVDLLLMGSTREEVGGSGAAVGTFALAPDCCIIVDVTHGKTPDAPADETFPLGKGPAIGIGPNMTRWMTQRMQDKAKELSMPVQTEVMAGNTGTNAWHMQISREGIPCAVLSIPLRYMHTPNEVIRRSDLEQCATLLAAFVRDLGKEGRWNG